MPLFLFLKYVKPTWYFNLRNEKTAPIFFHLLPEDETALPLDKGFKTREAYLADAAYLACETGLIRRPEHQALPPFTVRHPKDNYRFIRRHFHVAWMGICFMLRVLTLHNPITELAGFMAAWRIPRVKPQYRKDRWPDYHSFSSALLSQNLKVTVVIPTLNRYEYLKDVFIDLAQQTYQNFEVVVVDQTEPLQESVYQGHPYPVLMIPQKEKALWKARDTAIRNAKGDLILLYDDDSRVEPDWIEQHIKTLDYFNCDISSGVSISKVGDKVPEGYSIFKYSDQIDTGNVMFRKSMLKDTGLFDFQYEKMRGGDGEFGLRCYLAGKINISNPNAWRLHLKADAGGLRAMGSWDAYRTKGFGKPRPIPSVLYYIRNYFGKGAARMDIFARLPMSIMPMSLKKHRVLVLPGMLIMFLIFPYYLFQVIKSWRMASAMLKSGPKIGQL